MDPRRSFRCDRCPLYFSTPEELNRHKFHKHIIKQSPTHSPSRSSTSFLHLRDAAQSSAPFSSPGSRASFDSSTPPQCAHLSAQYQCRYCGLTFSLPVLQEHIRTVHAHRPPPASTPLPSMRPSFSRNQAGPSTPHSSYRCYACSSVFLSEHERAHHVASAHPVAQPPPLGSRKSPRFRCHLCDKTLSTQSNLREHINSYHRKERRYECPKCGLKFARKSIVTKHLENIHGRQRRYRCPSCDATFDEVGPFSKHYHQCRGSASSTK
eukprot:gb/GEZJ01001411.1/.p1 GENE.gb/GEZJ01001411.1/~~gb/GEZJ01001411.1/.p1  ORF type:complete len:266 (-),score=7.78 gb/GEZJ01001411.1/:582-1379(-)